MVLFFSHFSLSLQLAVSAGLINQDCLAGKCEEWAGKHLKVGGVVCFVCICVCSVVRCGEGKKSQLVLRVAYGSVSRDNCMYHTASIPLF